MKVSELLEHGKQTISFEFFPPKTPEQEEQLFAVITRLKAFNPDYVSVTYGALGTTHAKTFFWVKEIKQRFGVEPVAHLTCVAASQEEMFKQVKELVELGVENILALRGDPPQGGGPGSAFKHASELVALIKKSFPQICLGVAGYPEKHPEARNLEEDIKQLKAKVEAGADYIVTQLFFDNKYYFDFVEKCRQADIRAPIIPGLMPITSLGLLKKMTDICGAKIPASLLSRLEKNKDDAQAVRDIGVEQAVAQCQELIANKVPGLHFFVMNQAGPISEILKKLF